MIQELIILGFLKKRPASGYDIKKFIQKELGVFSHLENQSIYYPLERMEKDGRISRAQITGDQRLKKYIYSITAKGEKAFEQLCKKALLSQSRPFIELDIVLYFLPLLERKQVLPLLRLRLRFLQKAIKWLGDKDQELKDAPANLHLLLEHHRRLATTEAGFMDQVVKTLRA